MQLTRIDLENHLREQLHFLEASCTSFDAGHVMEHKRIAQTLRILLFDGNPSKRKHTRQTRSLLNHLGVKEKLTYINTADPFDENNLAPHTGLLLIQEIDGRIAYTASLDTHIAIRNPRTSFQLWWDEIVLRQADMPFPPPKFRQHDRIALTRGDIIKSVADQDGGAHIDSELNEPYANLAHQDALGYFGIRSSAEGTEHHPLGNPIPPTLRQIALEVSLTINRAAVQVFVKTRSHH
ncbi:hypothetical protein [Deinococcus frigens]|uniref:hypothetical protein n=1 Tax=Deinococcus frigens TaxID=249403 RepID=UPI0012ECA370|nr:hypothetical protein [Deinococcus frigens]